MTGQSLGFYKCKLLFPNTLANNILLKSFSKTVKRKYFLDGFMVLPGSPP